METSHSSLTPSLRHTMNDHTTAQHIEGLLFALGKALTRTELMKMLEVDSETLERGITKLRENENRGVVVVDDSKALELRISPEAAGIVEKVRRDELSRDIGRAGLEVLAAIIYRGPLSRSDIDFIRGVNSAQTLRTLSVRGLIRRIPNPKDERSFLYEPTTELLASLGATHVRDIPEYDSVREKLQSLEVAYKEQQRES